MKQREIIGSLFERNGKYTAILNLYDENGKRKQKSIALGIPVKGNKRKAQARLDPFFRERRLRLCDIEPQHIRELHESIFKDGCNANTVIHYHAVVQKALQYAVKNELISENAADKVDRPKKGKYLAGFYSKEELAALFEATKDDSMSVVIQLAAYYGTGSPVERGGL